MILSYWGQEVFIIRGSSKSEEVITSIHIGSFHSKSYTMILIIGTPKGRGLRLLRLLFVEGCRLPVKGSRVQKP